MAVGMFVRGFIHRAVLKHGFSSNSETLSVIQPKRLRAWYMNVSSQKVDPLNRMQLRPGDPTYSQTNRFLSQAHVAWFS